MEQTRRLPAYHREAVLEGMTRAGVTLPLASAVDPISTTSTGSLSPLTLRSLFVWPGSWGRLVDELAAFRAVPEG